MTRPFSDGQILTAGSMNADTASVNVLPIFATAGSTEGAGTFASLMTTTQVFRANSRFVIDFRGGFTNDTANGGVEIRLQFSGTNVGVDINETSATASQGFHVSNLAGSTVASTGSYDITVQFRRQSAGIVTAAGRALMVWEILPSGTFV